MEIDPKERFQHLHKELTEYQVRLMDMSIKATGLSLLILGWLITSDAARRFVATSARGCNAAIIGVAIMEIGYVLIALRMSHVQHDLARELNALDYFPRSYYEFRVYPPRMIAAAIGAVVSPAAVAIALMLMRV